MYTEDYSPNQPVQVRTAEAMIPQNIHILIFGQRNALLLLRIPLRKRSICQKITDPNFMLPLRWSALEGQAHFFGLLQLGDQSLLLLFNGAVAVMLELCALVWWWQPLLLEYWKRGWKIGLGWLL